MRILHLPNNIASQITTTVRALRDLGMEARGIAPAGIITANEAISLLPNAEGKGRVARTALMARRWQMMLQAIQWADVVHWHFQWGMRNAFDVRWAQWLRKKRVVEFWGSDIRIPEVEMADNPYYAQVFPQSEYRDRESRQNSLATQSKFAALGVTPIVADAQMDSYLSKDLFVQAHYVRQRIYLPDYDCQFPAPTTTRPTIVHSPSAPIIKGTAAVKAAIAQLQPQYAFDFQLIQGVSHHQAKQMVRDCDIFVDQLVLGVHGLAALEAMAYGKPVVCYIKPSMIYTYPLDFPIVTATMETLPAVLAQLLEDGQLRHELGQRGRAYVEQHHDAHRLAQQLLEIYRLL